MWCTPPRELYRPGRRAVETTQTGGPDGGSSTVSSRTSWASVSVAPVRACHSREKLVDGPGVDVEALLEDAEGREPEAEVGGGEAANWTESIATSVANGASSGANRK